VAAPSDATGATAAAPPVPKPAEPGIAPASVPPLHLFIGDLRLGDAKLGEARLETWPTDKGMHIDQLRSQSSSIQVTASGDWNGNATTSRTHLAMDFAAENLGGMLDALGFGGLFEGGRTQARLDASWPGGPSALTLANMNGQLRVDVAKGRIPEVQPGVGRLIKEANPQVLPVFIAGLGNDLAKQVLGNWFGGDKIRIHFGERLDLSEFIAKKDHLRTYKEIGEFVMSKIAELGESDRALYGGKLATEDHAQK